MKVKVTRHFDAIRIHIGSILHLHLDRSKLLAVHSWRDDRGAKWCIEYVFAGGSTVCEYDNARKFREVLSKVEAAL